MTATGLSVTGIVLAGGRSSRFRGAGPGDLNATSKLDADLAGRTVLDRTIAAVAEACDEVFVVGRPAGGRKDVAYLADDVAFEGPLAGLRVGLSAALGTDALVVGGDMPVLRPQVLRLLLARLTGSATAAVLDDGSEPRPLPMAVRRDVALAAATAAIDAGDRSLRALLGRLDSVIVPMAAWRALDPHGDTLLDIDTPADLARARLRLTLPTR
jgi:molybdenum cofactor guanylyltransferase